MVPNFYLETMNLAFQLWLLFSSSHVDAFAQLIFAGKSVWVQLTCLLLNHKPARKSKFKFA